MSDRDAFHTDTQPSFTIAVVGGAIMDLVFETERMPEEDESFDAQSLDYHCGGKGSNTAIAIYRAQHEKPATEGEVPRSVEGTVPTNIIFNPYAPVRHDVDVYLNTDVGTDAFGTQLKEELEKNHIKTSRIGTNNKVRSGTCAVFVDIKTKHTRDIGFPGANTSWMPPESDSVMCLVQGNRRPDLVVCHLETKRETIEEVLATAARHGVPTLFNPSPVSYILGEHYKNMTHLVINKNEAAELTGKSTEDLLTPESWGKAAKFFLNRGVNNVVITLGDKGAYYATDDGVEGFVDAVQVVNPKDMTGAGDTFVGYYAMDYVRQKHDGPWIIRKAVELGCKAAVKTISGLGAQAAIPWADEVEA